MANQKEDKIQALHSATLTWFIELCSLEATHTQSMKALSDCRVH